MPLSLETFDRILRDTWDTYGVAMRREAVNEILNPNPLQKMLGMKASDEDIANAWETLRDIATTHPDVTRSPFDGIDWDMVVAPEWTQNWKTLRLLQRRREYAARALAGDFDDEVEDYP